MVPIRTAVINVDENLLMHLFQTGQQFTKIRTFLDTEKS